MSSQIISTLKGIEQGRAAYAYLCVKKVAEEDSQKKDYKAYVKKIPMMIKTNGLGATLAFIKAKSNAKKESNSTKAYKLIYEHLTKWLGLDEKQLIDFSGAEDLLECVVNMNSSEYPAVTTEVLAFTGWLRRFAEGIIEDDKDKKTDTEAETNI